MAELEQKFFGRLKGSLGDVVFRSRNDKNFISHRPKSYTAPDDPNYKERTGKFKMSVKLASAIYSFFQLKKIWNDFVPAGKTAFNNLVQTNYPYVSNGNLSNRINLVPKSSFGINLDTLTLDNNSLVVNLEELTEASNIDTIVEKQLQLLVLVFLETPVDEAMPPYEFINLSSGKQTITLNNPLTFNIPLSTTDKMYVSDYSNKKVLFTALTYDENDNVVQFSSTINHSV